VNPNRHNSKAIFLIFILVAMLGYFILPLPQVQQGIPLILGKTIAELDVIAIPNEKTALSEREILSKKCAEDPVLPSYLVCSIDDDPDGTNAYGIYDPTDLAVTVSNLVRLNTRHLFLGTHLYWPDLPSIENNTLNSQLERLDSCILSVPLRRSAAKVDIPNYLLDSSVALAEVNGNTLTLPRVNNLSLFPTMKIPNNCKVGFSQLESEPETSNIPLLAVWGDRVILSSLLLERMHHLNANLQDIQITIGKFISLGGTGNVIAIDEFGYFSPTISPAITEPHIISADITSVKKSPLSTVNTVLTASGVQADNYRAIEFPVQQLIQLAMTPVYQQTVNYRRIAWWVELILVIVVAFLMSFSVRKSVLSYYSRVLSLAAVLILSSMFLSQQTTYYSPIIYLLVALMVCMLVFPFIRRKGDSTNEPNENEHGLDELLNETVATIQK
jgi:hypothetical protein